jgi:hypothetical protein
MLTLRELDDEAELLPVAVDGQRRAPAGLLGPVTEQPVEPVPPAAFHAENLVAQVQDPPLVAVATPLAHVRMLRAHRMSPW